MTTATDTTTMLRALEREPCAECGGSGVAPVQDADLGGDGVTNSACPACNGTRLRFPVLTRECPRLRDHDHNVGYDTHCTICGLATWDFGQEHRDDCPLCEGTGRVPIVGSVVGPLLTVLNRSVYFAYYPATTLKWVPPTAAHWMCQIDLGETRSLVQGRGATLDEAAVAAVHAAVVGEGR